MTENQEDKWFLARVEDLAEEADKGGYVTFSDFLDDHKQSLLTHSVGRLSICKETFGGYEEAERRIAAFCPDFYIKENPDYLKEQFQSELCYLRIEPADKRFLKKIPGHRDYLGAILGTGIKREKVGDLLIDENGCVVIVKREIADYLKQELTGVGAAIVHVSECGSEALPAAEKGVEMTISVSSLRIDSLVAHGFQMGRESAQKLIRQGLVSRNGMVVVNGDRIAEPGDKLTLRGKGRLIVREDLGISKSGRHRVKIERFAKK